jgi:hypothetical protein
MTVDELIEQINTNPDSIDFTEVMTVIEATYNYTATRFHNGVGSRAVTNEAGTNAGLCKIFAFGKLHKLDEKQTLACFGKYYREDVLGHPDNDDHANIRNFMLSGWAGIRFEGEALHPWNTTSRPARQGTDSCQHQRHPGLNRDPATH